MVKCVLDGLTVDSYTHTIYKSKKQLFALRPKIGSISTIHTEFRPATHGVFNVERLL